MAAGGSAGNEAPRASPIDALTSFRAVALVGGSPGSYWTEQALRNLATGRPAPRVFTVHPRGRRVGTVPCARTIADAPVRPDLAIVLVPVAAAADAVAEAAAAGARAAIVVGDAEPGAGAEAAGVAPLREIALRTGIVLLGPSSLGLVSPARRAFPFVGRLLAPPPCGRVGFATASGAIAVELLRAMDGRFGLSHLVGVGAGASIGIAAAIEALVDDAATGVVGAYLEDLDDPGRLARAAARAHAAGKAIVVLRGGRDTEETRRAFVSAAASRAEADLALGGREARLSGFLRHHGIAEVAALEELVEALVLLDGRPRPPGRRLGIVSVSAAAGRLAADAFTAAGFDLPPAGSGRSRRPARGVAAPGNPLDLTGRAVQDPREGARRVRAFAADASFDVVVLASQPPRGTTPSDRRILGWTAALADGAAGERLALPVHLFHGSLPPAATDPRARGNPFLCGLREAAAALRAACDVGEACARRGEAAPAFPEVDAAAAGGRLLGPPRTLSEPASLDLLERYGVPVARWKLCTTATAAARFARDLGGPVAVKAATPDVEAKAAAGLVRLGVAGDSAVRAAFHDVTLGALARVRPDRLLGATVMEMVDGAVALVCGVARDPRLGLLVLARRDEPAGVGPPVVVRAAPLPRSAALGMARELRLGQAAREADLESLADVLARLARLGHDLEAMVAAACVGPLLVRGEGRGCAAVGAGVVLRPAVDAAPPRR
jgi:acetyl-CoA synthetase/acetyltransferase